MCLCPPTANATEPREDETMPLTIVIHRCFQIQILRSWYRRMQTRFSRIAVHYNPQLAANCHPTCLLACLHAATHAFFACHAKLDCASSLLSLEDAAVTPLEVACRSSFDHVTSFFWFVFFSMACILDSLYD